MSMLQQHARPVCSSTSLGRVLRRHWLHCFVGGVQVHAHSHTRSHYRTLLFSLPCPCPRSAARELAKQKTLLASTRDRRPK